MDYRKHPRIIWCWNSNALLSHLLLKALEERNGNSKALKRLKAYSEINSSLSEKSDAKKSIEDLIVQEIDFIIERRNRKINGANLAAVIFLAGVGGTISALLVFGGINSDALLLKIIFWVFFAISALFTIAIPIVGKKSMFTNPSEKEKK